MNTDEAEVCRRLMPNYSPPHPRPDELDIIRYWNAVAERLCGGQAQVRAMLKDAKTTVSSGSKENEKVPMLH